MRRAYFSHEAATVCYHRSSGEVNFYYFFNTTGVTALLTGTVTPGQAGLHIIAASHVHIKMICGGVNLSSETLCKGGLRDKQR